MRLNKIRFWSVYVNGLFLMENNQVENGISVKQPHNRYANVRNRYVLVLFSEWKFEQHRLNNEMACHSEKWLHLIKQMVLSFGLRAS